MKYLYILAIVVYMAVCSTAFAQVRTVTFTGRDWTNHYHIPLHHVTVFNLDQLWEEVLYYPDTTLMLGTVGIDDYDIKGVQLMQNVPNPFDGTTEFALTLPEDKDVFLEIYDINGKLAVGQHFSALQTGTHLYKAILSSPQTYLLSAKVDNGQMTIKMVNEGHGAENSIRYLGMTNSNGDFTLYLKDDKSSSNFPFNVGDEMRYTGYAVIDGDMKESNTVSCHQTNSETYTLQFDVTAPTVTTTAVNNLTSNSASCGGNVTASGGSQVISRGVCWSTSHCPVITNNHTTSCSGTGSFTNTITGLSSGTTYYVRAYATNSIGTSYGSEKSFTTLSLPIVTTNAISNIAGTTATCGGNVTSDGGDYITARGVCWSTSQNPTISGSHTTNGSGTGSFTSNITGLTGGTTYYVRAYATNSVGTAYGEQRSFTTLNTPTVTTNTVSNITGTSASCGGNVTATGGAAVTARGVCWSTSQNPTISNYHTTNGSGTGSFTSSLTGLSAGTTYYVRAYATNSVGTSYGTQRTFTTNSTPTVTTNTVTNITATSATCGGNVIATGGSAVTARGVCWSTSQNPTINNSHTSDGSGTGNFTSSITGLSANTTYYVRAYATNIEGTVYGTQRSFSTIFTCGSSLVSDYDGNNYSTVQIGGQCWMSDNLRTTHYSNGAIIALGSSASTTTAYRYYPNNNSNNVNTYGYLYNWKAVMHNETSSDANPSGIQGICPTGWHVPSDAEWTQMTNYISSLSVYICNNNSVNIAKSLASMTGWFTHTNTCAIGNNTASNNTTGFNAPPAGCFQISPFGGNPEEYIEIGNGAAFWSSYSYSNSDYAWIRLLWYYNADVDRFYVNKSHALSVRCLKD